MLCEPRSAFLLVVALACYFGLLPAEPATCINPGTSVQCSAPSEEGNCLYRNCTDPGRSIEVSFRACLESFTEGSASVSTSTNVTCKCLFGDVTIQVEMPNGQTADYSTLGTEPNPELLNASRCNDKDNNSKPYFYCMKFSNLSMVEGINTSMLVSEVTSALNVTSSKACLIIEYSAPISGTQMSPPSGAMNALPKIAVLLLPLLCTHVLFKLLDGSLLFST